MSQYIFGISVFTLLISFFSVLSMLFLLMVVVSYAIYVIILNYPQRRKHKGVRSNILWGQWIFMWVLLKSLPLKRQFKHKNYSQAHLPAETTSLHLALKVAHERHYLFHFLKSRYLAPMMRLFKISHHTLSSKLCWFFLSSARLGSDIFVIEKSLIRNTSLIWPWIVYKYISHDHMFALISPAECILLHECLK